MNSKCAGAADLDRQTELSCRLTMQHRGRLCQWEVVPMGGVPTGHEECADSPSSARRPILLLRAMRSSFDLVITASTITVVSRQQLHRDLHGLQSCRHCMVSDVAVERQMQRFVWCSANSGLGGQTPRKNVCLKVGEAHEHGQTYCLPPHTSLASETAHTGAQSQNCLGTAL